jgi:hypothetical protein
MTTNPTAVESRGVSFKSLRPRCAEDRLINSSATFYTDRRMALWHQDRFIKGELYQL